MSISWKSTVDGFALAVTLTMGGCACLAAAPDDKAASGATHEMRYGIASDVAPARQHASDLRLLTGYEADLGECGDVMLGPLKGEYSGKEAWRKLIAPVCTLVDRGDGLSGGTQVFADMSDCKCSFGFPRLTRLQHEHVLVTGSRLPRLEESSPSPAVVMDREHIEEIGAVSVPDLLRYISQSAFHRGRGFRASGAQYAELRGLGAGYTLVLLNGRRAIGTVTDLTTNAFDLSYIPISAVERVEITMDANSLVHGMDAIGGIVNVVLKNRAERDISVRYGFARGGGSQSQASISGGIHGERGQFAVFFDAEQWSELLGRKRDRWNNQNFTRFGGLDYRSPFGSPFNVRSTDGQHLPGLGASAGLAELDPLTGRFNFVAGQRSSTSLRAFQAIVPESSRVAALANGSLRVGASIVSLELLAVKRENELQIMPPFVPGNLWGARHPDNPFGVPVRIDAVLAGLPAQRQHYHTTSHRSVLAMKGPLGAWEYAAFVVRSDEQAQAQLRNTLNPAALDRALQAADDREALSLYSTVQRSFVPEGLLVNAPMERYRARTTHLQASTQGSLFGVKAHLGVEHRHERLDFDRRLHGARRDITSIFAHVRVPLINSTLNVPGVQDLKLLLGARQDHYSDVGAVTKTQLGLAWQLTKSIHLQTVTSESFRPPSLVELNLPRTAARADLFDARRSEAIPVELLTGGNPHLHPTTARSRSVGVTFKPREGVRLSAEYWRVKARHHIALLAPMALLAHEDDAIEGRIVRASPSAEDQAAGRPGRLLQLDISRANVGGAAMQGVDVAAEAKLQTGIGAFTPRLSVTLTDEFAYSDLPITQIRLEDRTGVASEFGTIPAQRGVVSLAYERSAWRAAVYARVITSYQDRDATTGKLMQRSVRGGAVWDLNVSKKIVGDLRLMLGAFNVTDRRPPYAHAGGSLGFDTSQSDLEGRQFYVSLGGTF